MSELKPSMFILSAPSGAGKSSFIDRILKEVPELRDTITYTTREMRTGESEGDPYHFVSEENFRQLIDDNHFVEWEQVHDSLYGTPFDQIESAIKDKQVLIMDIDVKGAKTLSTQFKTAVSFFILPPSIEVLRERILGRDRKVPENLELRLENARIEIEMASQFDHQIVNDDFEVAYGEFKAIILDYLSTLPQN